MIGQIGGTCISCKKFCMKIMINGKVYGSRRVCCNCSILDERRFCTRCIDEGSKFP